MLAENYEYKGNRIFPTQIYLDLPHPLDLIVKDIIAVGGNPYLVGGGVLDVLCNSKPKDWDIEVFYMSYERLIRILEDWGSPDLIGNKFGIVKLKLNDIDMEFSIPRIDSKIGIKHQDFDVKLVPDLTLKQAANRRDFTINAIYINLDTNKIYDPTGRGVRDLKESKLDQINYETFTDDPLRILRAVQILSRKVKNCSKDLAEDIYMSVTGGILENVPGEAIFQEFNKMWMKADSEGILNALQFVEDTGIIDHFPVLVDMKNCEQKAEWHPEGDVWEHTKLVMAEAAHYRDLLPKEWQLAYMWGMFLHDIGKPKSVDPETGSMHGHDKIGVDLARTFMEKFTLNKDLNDKVCAIVEGHMRPRIMVESGPRKASWRRLQNICRLDILAYVSVADSDGRPPEFQEGTNAKWFKHIMEVHEELGKQEGKIPPILMGRHLIDIGMQPGNEFGLILTKAYEIQLDTGSDDVGYILNETLKVLEGETNE